MNRKGTEKPIEIFVALFIILVVALVVLRFYEGQLDAQRQELASVKQEQRMTALRDKVTIACQEQCTQAGNNGCSLAGLASLCAYGSQNVLASGEYVDLNGNGRNDYDTSLLAGIGVCEDRLYCFHMIGSCCAREISPASCKGILGEYWRSKGIIADAGELEPRLAQVLPAGMCNGDEFRWDRRPEWTA